jgi:2-keto-4-pentenoate hydratase
MDGLPASCRPTDRSAGWAAQRALDDLVGPGVGWKIAATSPAGQKQLGLDAPLAGRLYDQFMVKSGAELPAGHLHMKTAEAEFAFMIARDLPPDGAPYSRAEVLAAVGDLCLAIEVPDSRLTHFASAGAPQLLADATCAGFFVLGVAVADWRPEELPAHAVTMRNRGGEVARGTGANVLGDPCEALVWLANELACVEAGLCAGEIVTTGACTPPNPIRPGDRLVADFGSFGRVSVNFAPANPVQDK